MTDDLPSAIFAGAHGSDDRLQYYADLIGLVSAFAQEHLGPDLARRLLLGGADAVEDETEH